jgi:hypothetical protein
VWSTHRCVGMPMADRKMVEAACGGPALEVLPLLPLHAARDWNSRTLTWPHHCALALVYLAPCREVIQDFGPVPHGMQLVQS